MKTRYDTCVCGARKMERSAKCLACYKRWPERFWRRVEKTETCWLWTGRLAEGYGITSYQGRNQRAHRVSWIMANGPIPEGLTIDHLCRVRNCVNPAHMEPVPNTENVRRGNGLFVSNARKTHCKHGHEFSSENTRHAPNGSRVCIRCSKDNSRRHRAKRQVRWRKLARESVLAIRAGALEGLSSRDMAAQFGVTQATINRVRQGAIWRNVR